MAAGTSAKQPVVKLRPSDAHRWLVCRAAPGYCARLEAEGRLPKQEFEYTMEGQRAHVLAAKLLLGEALPKDAEKEMVQHVEAYAAHVRKRLKSHKSADLLVEHKVDVYYSDRTGYVDAAVIETDGTSIDAIDLKYGRGVSVKAERNAQLGIYLKSLIKQLGDLYSFTPKTKVRLTIWQPRVQGEKTERTWETTVRDIDTMCEWIDAVAKDILENPYAQKFEPGEEACQFCPAAPLCEARARDLLGSADEVLDVVVLDRQPGETLEVTPPLPATLTPDQLARVLQVAPTLKAWLKRCEEFALAGMEQGKLALPGHKLVRGRLGNRKWVDQAKAEALLRRMFPKDVVTPPELISPAAAEVLMKERNARQKMWDEFEALVARAEGNLALAPLDDERPAVDPALEAAEHFDVEGEELL